MANSNYTTAEADYCWLKEYPAVQVYILPFRSSHVRCSPGRPPLEKLHRGFPREPQTCVHLPKLSDGTRTGTPSPCGHVSLCYDSPKNGLI